MFPIAHGEICSDFVYTREFQYGKNTVLLFWSSTNDACIICSVHSVL